MQELLRRVWYTIRQRQLEAELAEEMEFHRAMTQRELQHDGASRADADARAQRRFGNATLAREDARAIWIRPWLESIWQDAAYAARNLRRQAGLTALVLTVLSAVIGLHTTLITVLAGVVLRPWPGIRDASRVVAIYLFDPSLGPQPIGLSLADARRIGERARSLSGVATMTATDVRIGSGDAAEAAAALMVSGNFFELLGITMAHGRGFAADEDRLGAARAVTVLGYDYWQSRFGGDAGIIGQQVRLNDVPFTIVGVSSREFTHAEPSFGKKLFVPVAAVSLLRPTDPSVAGLLYSSDSCCSDIAGRLAPGATRAQARAELDVLSRDVERPAGAAPRSVIVTDTAFLSYPGRGTQPLVAAAMITAGLVLVWLIACANIGNLLLARAAARVREIGIRLSLGASRGRLVRQLLTEGFVLGLGAATLGVGIAYELPFLILRFMGGTSASFPFSVEIDGVVLGYAVLLAAASSIAFGLAPALHATGADLTGALSQRDGRPGARFALRGVLLGIQVAVSVVLLASAGLLVRGAQHQTQAFDPGFAVADVSVVSFELPPGAYDTARKRAFYADLTTALHSLPPGTVDAFGFATWEPSFLRRGYPAQIRLPGDTTVQTSTTPYAEVSPSYLDTLRIPIVAGRNFDDADSARPVVVINEAMARQYWPNQNPVGRTFSFGGANQREVVGVMRDAHTNSLGDITPMFYQPFRDDRVPRKLIARGGAAPLHDAVTRIVERLDPRVRVQTMPLSATLEARLLEARTAPMLAGVLGAFALALSTIGMFGVFAYAVRQRTREIGVRMALGAPPAAVVRLILGGHSRAVVAGLGVGLVGAMVASVVLRSRLHGMSAFDPLSYLGVAAILTVAGIAASAIPLRRAVRIDPAITLRYE